MQAHTCSRPRDLPLPPPSVYAQCVYELATFCKARRATLSADLLLLSLEWPGLLSLSLGFGKVAMNDANVERSLSTFECRTARCHKPSDRARLLRAIRAAWGSEDAFDWFVQTELLEVFEDSKLKYQGQLGSVVAESFELAFGDAHTAC